MATSSKRKLKRDTTRPAPKARSRSKRGRAALTRRDVKQFEALLVEKRNSLLRALGGLEAEVAQSGRGTSGGACSCGPDNPADSGSLCQEAAIAAGLLANEREMLREIHDALRRIEDGRYGTCEATGRPIRKARLQARPWARYCIEYARQLEKYTPAEIQSHQGRPRRKQSPTRSAWNTEDDAPIEVEVEDDFDMPILLNVDWDDDDP